MYRALPTMNGGCAVCEFKCKDEPVAKSSIGTISRGTDFIFFRSSGVLRNVPAPTPRVRLTPYSANLISPSHVHSYSDDPFAMIPTRPGRKVVRQVKVALCFAE